MSALVAYYNAMTDEKNASADLQRAQAGKVGQESSQIENDSIAHRDLEGAQGNNLSANAAVAGPLAQSEIGLRNAQADATRVQTSLAPQSTAVENFLKTQQGGLFGAQGAQATAGLGASGFTAQDYADIIRQLARSRGGAEAGTTKIKPLHPTTGANPNGKPGATDTVPMMLAPGEAVLNKGAVEHVGEGVIGHMNKLGMLRMAAQKELADHSAAIAGHSATTMHGAVSKAKAKSKSRAAKK